LRQSDPGVKRRAVLKSECSRLLQVNRERGRACLRLVAAAAAENLPRR
jgi:hypothetical protein